MFNNLFDISSSYDFQLFFLKEDMQRTFRPFRLYGMNAFVNVTDITPLMTKIFFETVVRI